MDSQIDALIKKHSIIYDDSCIITCINICRLYMNEVLLDLGVAQDVIGIITKYAVVDNDTFNEILFTIQQPCNFTYFVETDSVFNSLRYLNKKSKKRITSNDNLSYSMRIGCHTLHVSCKYFDNMHEYGMDIDVKVI